MRWVATLSAAVTKQRADNAPVQVRTQPDVYIGEGEVMG